MSDNRWQQIEEIFQSALDLAPAERLSFVRESGADTELKAEVEKLLANYESADSFIETPVWTQNPLNSIAKQEIKDSLDKKFAEDVDGSLIGRRVGVFQLTKEIGRGGMGAVYLGERDDGEFEQKVAVKLIKRGMDTDFIVRRFRHERQILASLDHPNVARLLDGGTTSEGTPYFVMEYIEGEPIHQFCDKNRLGIRERLRIFQQVCSAVHYAHERQIIHRDIKPGNILVTATGTPKLLDFGIAKILDPDLIHESINPTSTMMRLMTLEYASPEQIRGGEITRCSDVYGLGVLLYELLSAHRPYSFAGCAPHEVSRIICEEMPVAPSAAVIKTENLLPIYNLGGVTPEKAALMRGDEDLESLRRELSGNLDNIILKALSKKEADRYDSVEEFIIDIERHLEGKAITAQPFNYTRRSQHKSVENTPTGQKSIAVLPLKLINLTSNEETGDKFLGVGLADALITRLSNIRRFIVRPTSSVLRFGDGQTDSFEAGKQLDVEYILDGHIQKMGNRIRVSVQLLNVAEQSTFWAERFDESFTDVLSLEDALSMKVAEALIPRLTLNERENLAKRGTENPKAYEAYLRGRYYWNTFTEEGFAKAILAYNEAIAHDPEYALAYTGIADYYNWLGVYGVLPAKECFQSAIESATKAIELDEELSEAHASLGFALVGGNYDWLRGEASCRRALDLNPNNASAHVWYSIQLFMEGRFDKGLRHARRAVKLDPLTPFNPHNAAWGLFFARRYEESIIEYREVVRQFPLYPLGYYGLSWNLRMVGRFDEAITAIKHALEFDEESTFMLSCYGQTLAAAGRRKDAEEVLTKLEQIAEKRYVSLYHIAIIYVFLGETEKALDKLEQAFNQNDAWMAWIGVEPTFDNLRAEPRFMNLFERTGNPLIHQAETVLNELEKNSTKMFFVDDKLKTGDQNQSTSEFNPKPKRSRFYPALAAAALVLMAFGFLAYKYNFLTIRLDNQPSAQPVDASGTANPATNASKITSVVILPFATVGAQTDDEQYLGVGTADLVSGKLSQISKINLRTSSAVRRYLNSTKSAAEIGQELAVDYVVSGTIERVENDVIAKLEMTETLGGRKVWSETFEQTTDNLLALQDSISERVANSLSIQLTADDKENFAKHFTENSEAQRLYLTGRYHFGKRTVPGLQQAITLFEQAIKADPNFALAYSGLADCYSLLNWYQEPPPEDAWANAQKAAEKAISLDDSLAEAHLSLAFVNFHFKRDNKKAEDEFRRAINLKPNYATAQQWYAFFLSAQERHNEAISVMRRAQELDPRSVTISAAVANVLFHARLYDQSIAEIKHALEIDPTSVGANAILRWNYEKKGMTTEALEQFEKEMVAAGDTPTSRAKKARVLAAVGQADESRRILEELIRTNQTKQITPYEIAVIYALLKEPDKSIEWLKKAKSEHAVGFSFAKVDPQLDYLRGNPKFEALLK
jgi:serine/threonine protein kinase/tetratricopeptide (TPR) repeat protein